MKGIIEKEEKQKEAFLGLYQQFMGAYTVSAILV